MKTKIFRIMSLSVCVMLLIAYGIVTYNNKQNITLVDQVVYADMEQFNYDGLKRRADIIALVRVKDQLNEKKSNIMNHDDEFGRVHIVGFYSRRDVEVIKYYKNEKEPWKYLKVQEPAAIEGNNYHHYDGYDTLEKGKEYILFMSQDPEKDNSLYIISAQHGVVNLENINTEEKFFEIGIKAMIEFESDLLEKDKKMIPDSKIVQRDNIKNDALSLDIETKKHNKTIYYTESSGEENTVFVRINDK